MANMTVFQRGANLLLFSANSCGLKIIEDVQGCHIAQFYESNLKTFRLTEIHSPLFRRHNFKIKWGFRRKWLLSACSICVVPLQ